jgi:hypothetical protein
MKTVIIAYYIYCLLIIFGCGYAVFVLDASGWLFLLALLLCNASPEIKQNKDEEKNNN